MCGTVLSGIQHAESGNAEDSLLRASSYKYKVIILGIPVKYFGENYDEAIIDEKNLLFSIGDYSGLANNFICSTTGGCIKG